MVCKCRSARADLHVGVQICTGGGCRSAPWGVQICSRSAPNLHTTLYISVQFSQKSVLCFVHTYNKCEPHIHKLYSICPAASLHNTSIPVETRHECNVSFENICHGIRLTSRHIHLAHSRQNDSSFVYLITHTCGLSRRVINTK